MSEKDTASGGSKPSAGGELIIPVAGILFTAYYFTTITDAPWTAQVNAFFLGSILILLSLILIGLRLHAWRRGEVRWSFAEMIEPREILGKRIMLLLITMGYVLVVDRLGFTITTFLLLFFGMLALGSRGILRTLLIAAGLAFVGWLAFVVAFGTRLPIGPFENMMRGLM